MGDFRDFLCIGLPEETVDEKLESVKLSLALKFLKSSNMKKRLTGINEIKGIVEATGNRGMKTNSWHDDSPRQASRWLKPEYLVKWINENQLIEYILGDSSHVEVIKRSSSVLIFLSDNGQLTKDHLDLLWKSLENKHEATVLGVFETINEIAGALDQKSLDYIFLKIESMPIKKYNEQTVKFVKEFTVKAFGVSKNSMSGDIVDLSSDNDDEDCKINEFYVENAKGIIIDGDVDQPQIEVPEYGLPVLFEISMQSTELGTSTLQEFIDMMKLRNSDSFRAIYILKCIKNLVNGVAVYQSISVLRSIFKRTFNFRSFEVQLSPENAMIKLDAQFNFINLIIENIERYNTLVQKSMVDSVNKGEIPENISKTKFEGNVTHSSQLESLLDFIEYIITTSNNEISIGTQNIQKLWNIFVNASSIEFDKNHFFKWL